MKKQAMNKIIFITMLLSFSCFCSFFSFHENNKKIQVFASEDESYGGEALYLRGRFSGVDKWLNTPENLFSYNKITKTYYFSTYLNRGDIFCIFQNNKGRNIMYPLDNAYAVEMFSCSGLQEYWYANNEYYWQVSADGLYDFVVDGSIEFVQSTYDIWGEDKQTKISYSFDCANQSFFLLSNPKGELFVYAEGDNPRMHQYGLGSGKKMEPLKCVSYKGADNDKIYAIPFDPIFSKKAIIKNIYLDSNNVEKIDSVMISLEDSVAHLGLNDTIGNSTIGSALKVLYSIEKSLGPVEKKGTIFEDCILDLTQDEAKTIINDYDKLSLTSKGLVDDSTITYVNEKYKLLNGVKIIEIIPFIREKTKDPYVFPVYAVFLPILTLSTSIVVLYFSLGFKRLNNDNYLIRPVVKFFDIGI